MLVLIFFPADIKIRSGWKNYLFSVKTPLKYLEGAPNFKTWPQLKNITITNIQNLILNSSFDALLK